MDALGSNIRVDSRGLEVMRVLPKLNEEINEEWISDKARFACDGLKVQRLDTPYIRKNGKLSTASWDQAIESIVKNINSVKGDEIAAIAGSTTCTESMFLLKKMFANLGSNKIDANQFGHKLDISSRSNYLFNTGIANAANADVCLLIGADLRKTAPVLNARIGKTIRSGGMHIARVGEVSDQTYTIEELGSDALLLKSILAGKGDFAKRLKKAERPMIIVGDAALSRSDGHAISALAHAITEKYNIVGSDWNGFNILHNHASMVGGLDVGFIYGNFGNGTEDILKQSRDSKVKMLYLLGADDFDMSSIDKNCFVIYQGHHGDAAADRADVILPEAAYTEQDAIFVNMEGRPQYARAAIPPLGLAKESWDIITSLANKLDVGMSLNSLTDVRAAMTKDNVVFANIDTIIPTNFVEFKSSVKLLKKPLQEIETNYYMTDPISRASVTMAKCTKEVQSAKEEVA